jgi:hypothetical protein
MVPEVIRVSETMRRLEDSVSTSLSFRILFGFTMTDNTLEGERTSEEMQIMGSGSVSGGDLVAEGDRALGGD